MENAAPVLVHVLNRDLLRLFPNSYIMLIEHQVFVILNLTKEPISIPMVRHRLADPCRDYCLYAGISFLALALSAFTSSFVCALRLAIHANMAAANSIILFAFIIDQFIY